MIACAAEMANFPVVSMTAGMLQGEDLQLAVICGWPFQTVSALVSSLTVEERRLHPKTNYPPPPPLNMKTLKLISHSN